MGNNEEMFSACIKPVFSVNDHKLSLIFVQYITCLVRVVGAVCDAFLSVPILHTYNLL